ncbi:hypothetical protein BJX61DRAFT_379024 [Aspergillus egyptiacus]|nr:hypothetical protein BJX61DRAFT_379024 [Aspergillus egyptiacus]
MTTCKACLLSPAHNNLTNTTISLTARPTLESRIMSSSMTSDTPSISQTLQPPVTASAKSPSYLSKRTPTCSLYTECNPKCPRQHGRERKKDCHCINLESEKGPPNSQVITRGNDSLEAKVSLKSFKQGVFTSYRWTMGRPHLRPGDLVGSILGHYVGEIVQENRG